MNKNIISSVSSASVRISKVIAKITLCGVFEIPVYDYMNWNPPTPEQIKNLKEVLNIDVKLVGKTDGKKE